MSIKPFFAVVVSTVAACADAGVVFVSPQGNDAAVGTAADPVRTPAGALRRVRQSRSPGEMAEIVFGAGVYALDAPLALGPDDSGLVLRADEGARVVFSGGRALPPFEAAERGLWKCRVPDGFMFEQLWVNGVRATRAKSPNDFYFHAAAPVERAVLPETGKAGRSGNRAFIAHPADIAAIAKLPPDELRKVVVRHYHSWNTTQARPLRVDAQTGFVLETPSCWWGLFTWPTYEPRYVLENYFAALDAPGEWFLDEKSSTLWYMPRPGETLGNARAVAPGVESFLTVAGDRANGRVVRDVTLRDLAFEYAGYRLSPNGQFSRQADVDVPSVVTIADAEGVRLERCRIEHISSHGVHFDRGTEKSGMSFCAVKDLGAGAVVIGEQFAPHTEPVGAKTERITVEDCILQSGGRIFAGSVGVWVGRASEIRIRHNDIGDFYYSGVSVGWTWGYVPTGVHDNDISYNHIHHVLQGVLSDGGGVYLLGDQPGTTVVGNRIHDVYSYDYQGRGSHGLYTDEGSARMLFASNLIYRTKYGALHQHYGRENVFRNNIFAFSRENMIIRTRMEKHRTLSFLNNIVYWDNDTQAVTGERRGPGEADDIVFDGNVYWSTKGVVTNAFLGADFATWQRNGHDVRGAVADPKFADPEHGDFALAADSPAVARGFVPFDPNLAGVRGPSAWRNEAARCRPPEVRAAPRPNRCGMGLTVGVASPMTTVFPRGPYVRPVAPAERAKIRLARGERESLQVLVTASDRDLRNVRVRAVGLTGVTPFAATNVACSVVGYSWTTFPADSKYDCSFARCEKTLAAPGYRRVTERAQDSWWPDVILGFLEETDIAKGDVQSFWVRVTCPRDQPAGLYEGSLVVTEEGAEIARLPLTVRVNGFAVPKTSPLPLAITYAPSAHRQADTDAAKALARRRSSDPQGPVALARQRPLDWADFLADYYITYDSLYTRTNLDFTVLAHLRDCGRLGRFNLGYFGYYRDEPDGAAKWRAATLPRLRANYERAKTLGIADRAYIYGCDEVPPEHFANVRDCVRILKEEFPGVPIFTTARDDAYGVGTPLGTMDWFAPIIDRFDPDRAAVSRREGRQVWWYICCGPGNPWPNAFTQCQPLELRYLMGAATQRMRPDGFLYYQISLWNAARPIAKGPYTDWVSASFMTLNGDGCWTGVGPGGLPLPTIRLENFRDGLEDLAYAKALERKVAAHPGWARAGEAKRLLAVPKTVMTSVPNFTDDPKVLLAWRDAMADLLEADVDGHPSSVGVCTVAMLKAGDWKMAAADFRRKGICRMRVESFHDGASVHEETLRRARDFFRDAGFAVEGLVTPGHINLWERSACCLADPIVQAVLRTETERAVRVFDRVTVDSSTFGDCTCAACSASGRQERAEAVIAEHILAVAKRMNPSATLVVSPITSKIPER